MNVVLLCAFNEEAVIRPTLLAVHRALGGGPEPLRVVLVDVSRSTGPEADRALPAGVWTSEAARGILVAEATDGGHDLGQQDLLR